MRRLDKIQRAFYSSRYQSGFQPPGDIPFEDLSKMDTESTHNNSQINHAINATMKGTIGAKNLKKRVGIFNIFSSNKVRSRLADESLRRSSTDSNSILFSSLSLLL